jgi:hypothetical protein
MLARPLAVLFTAAALLLAQQAAISHQIWHLAGAGGQAFGAQNDQQHKAPKKDGLCDLHTALGTVLGAVSANAPASLLADLPDARVAAAAVSAVTVRPLPPTSRGPPTLL